MADINLSPYTAESEAIARKLRIAQLLSQQANEPMAVPTQAGVRVSPLAGLANFMSGMVPPPPEQTSVKPAPKLGGFTKPARPVAQPPAASVKELRSPVNIDDLLKTVTETKKVSMPQSAMKKPGGSTGKNSVSIKL
jgi:hypothetical protein